MNYNSEGKRLLNEKQYLEHKTPLVYVQKQKVGAVYFKFLYKRKIYYGTVSIFHNATSGRVDLLSKLLVSGMCQVQFPLAFLDLVFSVVFLRNSLKYGLESFRKTHTEGIPPIVSGPLCDNWTAILQPNPTRFS